MTTLFRKLVIALKKEYPHLTMRIRREKLPKGYSGLTTKEDFGFLVRICRDQDEQQAIDSLLHEVPHCPAWDEFAVHGIEHGPQWGMEHSRCYRVLERLMDEMANG